MSRSNNPDKDVICSNKFGKKIAPLSNSVTSVWCYVYDVKIYQARKEQCSNQQGPWQLSFKKKANFLGPPEWFLIRRERKILRLNSAANKGCGCSRPVCQSAISSRGCFPPGQLHCPRATYFYIKLPVPFGRTRKYCNLCMLSKLNTKFYNQAG